MIISLVGAISATVTIVVTLFYWLVKSINDPIPPRGMTLLDWLEDISMMIITLSGATFLISLVWSLHNL